MNWSCSVSALQLLVTTVQKIPILYQNDSKKSSLLPNITSIVEASITKSDKNYCQYVIDW